MADSFDNGVQALSTLIEEEVSEQTEFQKAVEYLSTYLVGRGRFFGRTADELAKYLIESYQSDNEQARVIAVSNKIKDDQESLTTDVAVIDTRTLMLEFFPDYNTVTLDEVVSPSKIANKSAKMKVEDVTFSVADAVLNEDITHKKYGHILSHVLVGINKIHEGQMLSVKDDAEGEDVSVLSGSFDKYSTEVKKIGDNSEVEFSQTFEAKEGVAAQKAVLVGKGQNLTLKHAAGERAPRFAIAASIHGMVSFMEQKGIVDGVLAFNTKTPEFRSTLFAVVKAEILNMISKVDEKLSPDQAFGKISVKTVVIDGVSFSAVDFIQIKKVDDLDAKIAAGVAAAQPVAGVAAAQPVAGVAAAQPVAGVAAAQPVAGVAAAQPMAPTDEDVAAIAAAIREKTKKAR